MGNTFRQYAVGDKPRFAASQVNAWTAAARAHQQNQRASQAGSPQQLDVSRVPVSNESGTDLPPFSVLQLTGPAVDPTDDESEYLNRIAFTGGTVNEDDTDKIAIIQQYLPDGVIDPGAIVSGLTFARLTGDAGQTNATSKAGQTTLEAATSGPCVILYDPGPAGEERTACVKIGGGSGGTSQRPLIVEGYLEGNLTSGGATTMAIYNYHDGAWQATGESVNVQDRGGFPANSGAYIVAFLTNDPGIGDVYRPLVLGCT